MSRYHRKVIRITGEDSPNVRLAMAQIRAGLEPTHEILVPGVLPYDDFLKRLATWDEVRISIGIRAQFWEGPESLLFPPLWLDGSEHAAIALRGKVRKAESIGVDPGEGTANTAMIAGDALGVIERLSKKTPDTNVITGDIIAFMNRHQVRPEQVILDRGGGGKQHADRLRAKGYNVRTVAFGSPPSLEPRRGMQPVDARKQAIEDRYTYKNLRAEMYGILRSFIDPARLAEGKPVFAIPPEYPELRRQLAPIPLLYDGEGRLFLPPKNPPPAASGKPSHVITMRQLIGCSPDEADALVLMVYGLTRRARRVVAGAMT